MLELCDSVVGSIDTSSDDILGVIPAAVGNYAAYFRMNFRDASKPPFKSSAPSKSSPPMQPAPTSTSGARKTPSGA